MSSGQFVRRVSFNKSAPNGAQATRTTAYKISNRHLGPMDYVDINGSKGLDQDEGLARY